LLPIFFGFLLGGILDLERHTADGGGGGKNSEAKQNYSENYYFGFH